MSIFERGDLVAHKTAAFIGVVLSTEDLPEESDVVDKKITVVEIYRVSQLTATAEIEWHLEEDLEKIDG